MAPSAATPVIEASSVTLAYAGGGGVFEASIGLWPGEVVGLLGPNGSGKTTLLSVLAGLRHPGSGVVTWFGAHRSPVPAVRRRLGVLLDMPAHFDQMTGYQNAWFFARMMGLPRDDAAARLDQLFAWAGLSEARHRPVGEYSLGMRRRLALVEAIAHGPDAILLDEPTLALDFTAEIDLVEALSSLAREGCAILLATNDVHLAERLCARIAFVHDGQLVRDAPRRALLQEVGSTTRLELRVRAPIDLTRLRNLPGVAAASGAGDRVVAVLTNETDAARVIAGLDGQSSLVTEMQVRRPDLGDVFLKVTGATLGRESPVRAERGGGR